MKRFLNQNPRRGFTLAETLLVVAILVVLLCVAAVGVLRYQRSLEQLEMDGIAKEIFVAAQNHLTMAESQRLVSEMDSDTQWGTPADDADTSGVYYFVAGGSAGDARDDNALGMMLPFGAVDETALGNGSYVITYQPAAGRVVDVFYAERTGRFSHTFSLSGSTGDGAETYSSLMACRGPEQKLARRFYLSERSVIGWYGGEGGIPSGVTLKKPILTVENAEQLIVKVSNPNSGIALAGLKLIIEGEISGMQREIHVIDSRGVLNPDYAVTLGDRSELCIVLDDVTGSKKHFAEWTAAGQPLAGLIPGENITIKAMAYNNSERTNIQYSNARTTNSLFGDTAVQGNDIYSNPSWDRTTVTVKAFRHLENLDPAISGLSSAGLTVAAAEQKADLDWESFIDLFGENVSVDPMLSGKNESQPGTFLPVDLTDIDYTGKSSVSSISNLVVSTVNNQEPAGVFGTVTGGSISGLKLIDFAISSAKDAAGALAGSTDHTSITSVLVCNASKDASVSVTGSGAAGGLVGIMDGGSIRQCAAAVYVKAADGDAGGLAGIVTGAAAIEKSYAGGHTEAGRYKAAAEGPARFNVQAPNGAAGGLLGSVDTTEEVEIAHCYTTASVSGETAGGFAGSIHAASGSRVETCYETGLVSGTAASGAFAGSASGAVFSNASYFSMVNTIVSTDGTGSRTETLLPPVTGQDTMAGVTPFDVNVTEYNKIARNSGGAAPYDETILKGNYNGKYAFSTINDLTSGTDPLPDWLNRHYGDWPSMETMIVNTPG